MTRWRFPLIVAGFAAVAGGIGCWIGPTQPHTFAQETQPIVAQAAEGSSDEDRGWIGVMVEEGPDGAVLVKDVFPGGPAAFARLRRGDALLRIGDATIPSEEELARAIEQLAPSDEVVVLVRRNGQEQSLRVHVGSLHDFHVRYAHEMMRRDPRDPNFGKSHGVSQADQSVEVARRLFEQNQRLETALHELRQEVSELRRELRGQENGTKR